MRQFAYIALLLYGESMIFYAVITKEDDWYVATALPSGVTSQGKTIEEAKKNIREAVELYYEDEDINADEFSEPLLAPIEMTMSHG